MNSNENEAETQSDEQPDQQATKPPDESQELPESNNESDYWPLYVEQQKRRACPGCGDDGLAL